MSSRRLRSRQELTTSATSSRPRRGVAGPSTTIERTSTPSDSSRQSIRLTVKAPPSKLRQVINGRDVDEDATSGNRPVRQGRRKAIVESSDEDMDSEQPNDTYGDEEEDEDDVDGEKSAEEEDDDMEDAEGDDADEDAEGEDVDMDDVPARPLPSARGRTAPVVKPTVKVTPASTAAKPTVIPDDDDDDEDELSELDSQEELEEEDQDEEEEDEDAEGEEADAGDGDEDMGEEDAEGDDDDDLDSDDGTPASMSRSGTPDLSKLTRRQRAAFETHDGMLMALSNGMSALALLSNIH